jgi:methionyl-tRNA formyltransferase
MNIIFMGTPQFGIPSLEGLIANGYSIRAIVTAPDKPRGRGQQSSFTPVKAKALQHNIPVLQPENLRDPQFIESLKSYASDLIVVVAFRILPATIFTMPTLGTFNLHASLLPRYRGAAPINYAIINGDAISGVTTFFLREKVDTGNILVQRSLEIGADETAGELYHRLSLLGAEVVLETVRAIEQGTATPKPQDDTLATPAPKLFREQCSIDWNKPASVVHNYIRGLSPIPCAWSHHNGKALKIFRSHVVSTDDVHSAVAPGAVIIRTAKELYIACAQGTLSLLELQQEGKRRLSAEEFLKGYNIQEGERLVMPA